LAFAQTVYSAVIFFHNDLAGFNAAGGNPPVAVDFDVLPNGSISGMTINGVQFNATGSDPIVLPGSDTFSPVGFGGPANVLVPTSGLKVLSPGGAELAPGPNPALESDGLELVFTAPQKAFGFDILFQSLDGVSLVGVTLFDSANNVLYDNGFLPSTSIGAGGSNFYGFVSDAANIKRIVVAETDSNNVNPDSNIGYDTLRFGTAQPPVPEPATFGLVLAAGVLGLFGSKLRSIELDRAKKAVDNGT
jgi:hypothetical protein